MKALDRHHPTVTLLYFVAVTLPAALCMDPILLAISLLSALLLTFTCEGGRRPRAYLILLLFPVIALINPIFQHDGVTVLFFLNGNPVTLEALIFGLCAAAMTLSMLYWFRSMTRMMTSDKYLCVFGFASPRLALLLSMALRFVPLLGQRLQAVRLSQKALGLYRDGTLIDKLRGELRVFSIVLTWALENGIHTADSMEARAYGIGKRSSFSENRFHFSDAVLLTVIALLLAATLTGIFTKTVSIVFYPAISRPPLSAYAVSVYAAYTLLALLPTLLVLQEKIKWHFLQSKI